MGKTTKERSARRLQDMTMQTLGAGGKKSREQMRLERATNEAVQSLARRDLPIQELASAVRRCLTNMHGREWQCLVGRAKPFIVHVRYWRGKAFLFEGPGLRILVFQSAPPPLEGNVPVGGWVEDEQVPRSDKAVDRTSMKVLRSEMGQAYQRRVLGIASAAAKGLGKDAHLDNIVSAIKESLTEATGPTWHVVATSGGGEWGCSVAHEAGQLLDFKLNGDRMVVWKHAEAPPGLADLFTTKRISSCLFVVTVLLLCLYVKVQSSCDVCCSSYQEKRAKARCVGSDVEGEVAGQADGCDGDDAADAADRCLRTATILFFVTCGTLAGATALKWHDRRKFKHKVV